MYSLKYVFHFLSPMSDYNIKSRIFPIKKEYKINYTPDITYGFEAVPLPPDILAVDFKAKAGLIPALSELAANNDKFPLKNP